MKTTTIIAAIRRAASDAWENERGNRVTRCNFFNDGNRYVVDFAEDFEAQGWMQFDTSQDAPYFGFWVNPGQLMTLTYCEGDWSLVECPSVACYNAEVADACRVYAPGYIAIACSTAESCTALLTGGEPGDDAVRYMQDRRQFFREVPS